MTAPLEIELKLEFARDDGDRLAALDLLAGAEGEPARIVSGYFDTPDFDLRRAGYSLRVRRSGRRRIQTIKATPGTAGGLFVRPEWECRIEGDTPMLDPKAGPLAEVLAPKALAAIERLFETDVRRALCEVEWGDARIEVAIDRGHVRAGKAKAPLCELELELKSGPSRALFEIARDIDAVVPLRLGVRSKSERGYGLLRDEGGAVARADPLELDAEGGAADAFAEIGRSCLRQFRINEALLMAGGSAASVHQARVSLRRLRSAISLFRPLLKGDGHRAHLQAELRWLAGTLGELRNLDVLIGHASSEVAASLAAARSRELERVRAVLEDRRTRLLMIDLAEWLALGTWWGRPLHHPRLRRAVPSFAADILDDHRDRLLHLGRGLAGLPDERRHKVRIEAKKLRYAAEFFASLFPGDKARRRGKAFRKALEDVQDGLGELNDQVTGARILTRLGVAAASPLPDAEARAAALTRAEQAFKRLAAARPFWR